MTNWYEYSDVPEHAAIAETLSSSSDYRVLKRLPNANEIWCQTAPQPTSTTIIGVIDTETTGLDPEHDELIEIAIGHLTIDNETGQVVDVAAPQSWLEQPHVAITSEVESLTGISNAMVQGSKFDGRAILAEIDRCDVLVAHNARFDAGFMHARFPYMSRVWACSANELDWPDLGYGHARGLGALVTAAGMFMVDAHRAASDVWALTCLLSMPAKDGDSLAAHLVKRARCPTARLSAARVPRELTPVLKASGYRWHAPTRCWRIEGDDERIANEAYWLRAMKGPPRIKIETIDWHRRHTS